MIRPDGHAQIVIYHYDSLFMHLCIAFVIMVQAGMFKNQDKREAFRHMTDGPHCPISRCYTAEEFCALGREAGFSRCEFSGAACGVLEMSMLPLRFEALRSPRLDSESRRFLHDLEFDVRGCPVRNGRTVGINACFRFFA